MGGGEKHISLKLLQHQVRMRAVGFGFGESFDELSKLDAPLDIAFRPVINDFRGQQTVEAHLVAEIVDLLYGHTVGARAQNYLGWVAGQEGQPKGDQKQEVKKKRP